MGDAVLYCICRNYRRYWWYVPKHPLSTRKCPTVWYRRIRLTPILEPILRKAVLHTWTLLFIFNICTTCTADAATRCLCLCQPQLRRCRRPYLWMNQHNFAGFRRFVWQRKRMAYIVLDAFAVLTCTNLVYINGTPQRYWYHDFAGGERSKNAHWATFKASTCHNFVSCSSSTTCRQRMLLHSNVCIHCRIAHMLRLYHDATPLQRKYQKTLFLWPYPQYFIMFIEAMQRNLTFDRCSVYTCARQVRVWNSGPPRCRSPLLH